MGVDFRLLREAKERINKQDIEVGRCPYCKNLADIVTGKRIVEDKTPDGMVTVKVCNHCEYIVKAQTDAELARLGK